MHWFYSKRKTAKTEIKVEKNKDNDDRNQVDQSIKWVIYGNTVTKLIVPHQIVCDEHEASSKVKVTTNHKG